MKPIMLLRILLTVLLATIVTGVWPFSLSAQSFDTDRPAKKYQGLLDENDLRIEELKQQLQMGQAPPETMRLRYAGRRDDFLEFYDLVGTRIYYRYREDRFDRYAERRVSHLVKGEAYGVRGSLTGLIWKKKFISAPSDEFKPLIVEKEALPVFLYENTSPLLIEQIIWR